MSSARREELNTKPLDGRPWCFWCEDAPSAGKLRLIDDDGDPVPIPGAEGPICNSVPLCASCGWRFHESPSAKGEGVYVFEES